MKTSIATVSISGALPEKLDAIASAGFDGVEIFEQDFIAHDGGAREVGRMIRDKGLDITLFQPFRDFECLPEPLRATTPEPLMPLAISVSLVTVTSPLPPRMKMPEESAAS